MSQIPPPTSTMSLHLPSSRSEMTYCLWATLYMLPRPLPKCRYQLTSFSRSLFSTIDTLTITQADEFYSLPSVCNTLINSKITMSPPIMSLHHPRKFKTTLIQPINKISTPRQVSSNLSAYLTILLQDTLPPTTTLQHSLTCYFLSSAPTCPVPSRVVLPPTNVLSTTLLPYCENLPSGDQQFLERNRI